MVNNVLLKTCDANNRVTYTEVPSELWEVMLQSATLEFLTTENSLVVRYVADVQARGANIKDTDTKHIKKTLWLNTFQTNYADSVSVTLASAAADRAVDAFDVTFKDN